MIDSLLGYLTTTAMPSLFATGGIVGAAGLYVGSNPTLARTPEQGQHMPRPGLKWRGQ